MTKWNTKFVVQCEKHSTLQVSVKNMEYKIVVDD